MAQGTNNGGGPRWGTMERRACPHCGLMRPVGTFQGERGFACRNKSKCDARKAKREARQCDACEGTGVMEPEDLPAFQCQKCNGTGLKSKGK